MHAINLTAEISVRLKNIGVSFSALHCIWSRLIKFKNERKVRGNYDCLLDHL